MRARSRIPRLRVLLCISVMGWAVASTAQHGTGSPVGGGPGGGFGGGAFGPGDYSHAGPSMHPGDGPGGPGGLQLGPPGRWWDDKHFAKDLKLRPDQQKRMDSIFEANRGNLTKHLAEVHQEQGRFVALVHSKPMDEFAIDQEIERRSQARAELEKAFAHMMLQLRNEMDPDQVAKLEELR